MNIFYRKSSYLLRNLDRVRIIFDKMNVLELIYIVAANEFHFQKSYCSKFKVLQEGIMHLEMQKLKYVKN